MSPPFRFRLDSGRGQAGLRRFDLALPFDRSARRSLGRYRLVRYPRRTAGAVMIVDDLQDGTLARARNDNAILCSVCHESCLSE